MNYENEYEPLVPHTYPHWIKGGGLLCLFIFILFLFEAPSFNHINQQTRTAERAFKKKNFKVAHKNYEKLHKIFPSSKHIKLRLAQMLFTTDNTDAHEQALFYLHGMELSKYDWNELTQYMPDEYTNLFEDKEVQA